MRLTLVAVAIAYGLNAQTPPAKADSAVIGVVLTLETAKESYKVGEKILLTTHLRNEGASIIRIQRGASASPEFYHVEIEPIQSISSQAAMTNQGGYRAHRPSGIVRLYKLPSGTEEQLEFTNLNDDYDMTRPGE